MDLLGGRKFIYCLLVVAASFVLVLLGKLTPSDFTSFAQVMGGLYIVGNVANTVANGTTGQGQQPQA